METPTPTSSPTSRNDSCSHWNSTPSPTELLLLKIGVVVIFLWAVICLPWPVVRIKVALRNQSTHAAEADYSAVLDRIEKLEDTVNERARREALGDEEFPIARELRFGEESPAVCI
jgi:hypothetical protein